MSVLQTKTYTTADLLTMPDNNNLELVNGEIVEKSVSVLSSLVEGIVLTKLNVYWGAQQAGPVFPGTNGIQCFPDDPLKVRKPDAAFVKKERFLAEYLKEGFLSIAPDLAVEVLSPNDLASEVIEKVEEYLAAGIPLVWVIDPEAQIVVIHRGDGSVTKLRKNDELSGENIIPGFHCKVAELFPVAAQ
ncbi:MAG: Uma2 family endonuclease [Gemmataceae bacterium]|nr:Uma2 family endonuclease [Gemmataceae bacterium]